MPPLSHFKPATVTEILSLLKNTAPKTCELDPISTWLLKQLACQIAPVMCHLGLCNLFLKHGVFRTQHKQARVLLLLKKPTLDPDDACSYRSISNLPYFYKLIKRVVVSRFAEQLTIFSLTICCRCSSQPIDHFILPKQGSWLFTMTLTLAKYLSSFCST